MRQMDVAIVGGGLAGSMAAAMLGRAGIHAVLIDPHRASPPDFRCEKLDASQIDLLRRTGLADAVLSAATPDGEVWVARFGRLVARNRKGQVGIAYDSLVNTIRGEIPASVPFLCGKVAAIATTPDRQRLTLSSGEDVSARLVVLASGLGGRLRDSLGMAREDRSPCHSISVGFDVKPLGRPAFDFPALTYFPEHASDRMAYLTLFPIGSVMRANLFVYRELRDPWLAQLRDSPVAILSSAMPGLAKLLGAFEVAGAIKIRPVDLYVTKGYRQPGVVLVGDAFATSCPAAGTGANKVFTDVERLCNVHLPRWLASEGMSAEKIAAFYDDPVKIACDLSSAGKALYLKSLSTDAGLPWRTRRWGRFIGHLSAGALRQTRERLSIRLPARDRTGVADRRAAPPIWAGPGDPGGLRLAGAGEGAAAVLAQGAPGEAARQG